MDNKTKKALKISGITLASLVAFIALVGAIACWIVFTPSRVTPIVKKALNKTLTCQTDIDTVELTFFSTFPHFGLHISNLSLVNPDEQLNDTLCRVDNCTLSLNLMSYLRDRQLVVTNFRIDDGDVNLWVNADSIANYNIVAPKDEPDTSAFEMPFDLMDIKGVELRNVAITYNDIPSHIDAEVQHLDRLTAKLDWEGQNAKARLSLDADSIRFVSGDSTILFATTDLLKLTADGSQSGKNYEGKIKISAPTLSVTYDSVNYVDRKDLQLVLPFHLNLDDKQLNLEKSKLTVDNTVLNLDGLLASTDAGYNFDLGFSTPDWDIEQVLELVPEKFRHSLDNLDVKGELLLSGGRLVGLYNDSTMPNVRADIKLKDGVLKYSSFPYTLSKMNGDIEADINLNDSTMSRAVIRDLHVHTLQSDLVANGEVTELTGDPKIDLKTNVNISLPDAKALVSDKIKLQGKAKGPLNLRCNLSNLTNSEWEKLFIDADLELSAFDVLYNDSVNAKAKKAKMVIKVPDKTGLNSFKEYGTAHITTSQLDADLVGLGKARGREAKINVGLSNPMADGPLSIATQFNFAQVDATSDSLKLVLNKPAGSVSLYPNKRKTKYDINVHGNALKATNGNALRANSKNFAVSGNLDYDSVKTELLDRWFPKLNISLSNGIVYSNQLIMPVEAPRMKVLFTPSLLTITDAQIMVGASDFNLRGQITNLQEWLNNEGLLKGRVNLSSNKTDVYEIMDLVSGFGIDSTAVDKDYEEVANKEDDPFIVPLGTDLTLITRIDKAVVGNTDFHSVAGNLRVKDGVLVLDEMGMTCDAATMQLTAMYRSQRKNHLFLGADFHLLNIEVDKLIEMIPAIDTIVPMLSSFKGKAEFHLAAETYLKSDYTPKYSTLRGAAAIEGKDLVLLDSETFSTIAKYLLFNKKTENKVDTMSLELTLFRNEVDLYPFLIQMDKYKAVVQGRYSLVPHYNAHIETLAPIRLALNIEGDENANFKYRLGKTQYSDMYRPEKRNAVQERTLALKKLISDALKGTMKNEDYFKDDNN